jgi:hypothetical protein
MPWFRALLVSYGGASRVLGPSGVAVCYRRDPTPSGVTMVRVLDPARDPDKVFRLNQNIHP